MRTKTLLTLCLASIFISSCCNTTQTESRTIVAGKVINRTAGDPSLIKWYVSDPFSDEQLVVKLSEDGSFHMESSDVNLFQNRTIVYSNFITFFSAPGDSIYVMIDATKLKARTPDAALFSGDRAEQNNELHLYYNKMIDIMHYNPNPFKPFDMNVEPSELIVQLNERIDMCEDTMAIFEKQQKSPMSDGLRDFLHRDMLFGLANGIQGYTNDDKSAKLRLFSDPFFGINDSLNFCTGTFPYHLYVYINTKISLDKAYIEAVENKDHSAIIRSAINVIMQEPATLSRDAMAWKYLGYMLEAYPEYFESIPEVRTVFTTAKLNDKFAELVRKYNTKVEFVTTPIAGVSYMEKNGSTTTLPEGDIFEYLTQKYPNKVLYIDVYATWCGPCLAEFENSPALYDVMKGKDVVFIYLCLASDVNNWPKTVEQYSLKENYFFDEDATHLFMTTYNLQGYPSYILVGKDGEIITKGVNRPSKLIELSQQIDDLLK